MAHHNRHLLQLTHYHLPCSPTSALLRHAPRWKGAPSSPLVYCTRKEILTPSKVRGRRETHWKWEIGIKANHGIWSNGKNTVSRYKPKLQSWLFTNLCQLCDTNKKVLFESSTFLIKGSDNNEILFYGNRKNNVYVITTNELDDSKVACFSVIDDQTNLWHKRDSHLHLMILKHLSPHQLMKGLSKISSFNDPSPCRPCLQAKQTHVFDKVKNQMSASRCLELSCMDLIGPMQTKSPSKKKYIFVIVDDYSRYTWIIFFTHKSDTLEAFTRLGKRITDEKNAPIMAIKSDRGGEFLNDGIIVIRKRSNTNFLHQGSLNKMD